MRSPQRKPIVGILIIAAALVWLFWEGTERGKSYYKTLSELEQLGSRAYGMRLKVAGDVVAGSLAGRGARGMRFSLAQHGRTMPVLYASDRPVPDTFTDSSQVLVEGTLQADGVFQADQIQAKCASKYEARYQPGQPPGGR